MKPLETRLAAIFGLDHVPDVTESTLRQYRAHLLQHFDPTTVLTGREDFPWEESYVFGPPRPEEYEMMKKDNPSYKDEYVLVDILDEEVEERDGLEYIAIAPLGQKLESCRGTADHLSETHIEPTIFIGAGKKRR